MIRPEYALLRGCRREWIYLRIRHSLFPRIEYPLRNRPTHFRWKRDYRGDSSPLSLVTFEFCVATRRFVGRVRRESREDVLAAFAVNVTEIARKARREIVIFFCRDNSGQRDLFASRGVPWRTLADRKNRMPARKAGLAVSKTEVKRKVR